MGAKTCFAVLELTTETLSPPGSGQKSKSAHCLWCPHVIGNQRKHRIIVARMLEPISEKIISEINLEIISGMISEIWRNQEPNNVFAVLEFKKKVESGWRPPEQIKRTLHIVPR